MGETNPGDNDLDDDDSNSGQNPEEGEDESGDTQEEDEAPVEDGDTDPSDAGSVEEPTENTVEPVAEDDVEEDEETSEITVSGSQIGAAETTEATVTVVTRKDVTTEEDGGKKTTEEDSDPSDADVTFTRGCVNDNKLVSGMDLTFRVEPGPGRVLESISYLLSDAAEGAKPTPVNAKAVAGQEEKILNSVMIKGTEAKSITIYVKTKAAGYQVSFVDDKDAALSDSTVKVYEVNEDGKLAPVSKPILVEQGAEAKEFALVLVDKDKIVDDEGGVTLEGQTIELGDEEEYDQVDGTDKVLARKFEVDPSDTKYGLNSNGTETDAKVQIKARDKYTLNPEEITGFKNATLVEYTGTGTTGTLVKAATTGAFDADGIKKLVEGDEDYTKTSLAFAVKPDANYKITSVTAQINGEDAELEIGQNVITEGANKGTVEYTISLDQDALALDANKMLTIKIETALDDGEDNANIHRIRFAAAEGSENALDYVDITGQEGSGSAEKVDATKTIPTLADEYTITVKAKEGYELIKGSKDNLSEEEQKTLLNEPFVTIAETRKYDGIDDPVTYTHKEKVDAATDAVEKIILNNTTGDTNYEDGASGGNKPFVITAVTVTIGAVTEKNTDEKLVAFDDKLGSADKPSYAVTNTAGVLKDQYPEAVYDDLKDSTYTIAKSVDTLTFTVTSTVEPQVNRYVAAEDKGKIEPVTEENGVYTYSVPAAVFPAYDSADAKANKIVISKKRGTEEKTATVTVKGFENLAENGFLYEIEGEKQSETLKEGETALTNKPHVRDTVKMVFTAKKNVTFGEVTYKMGATEGTATIGTDEETKAATATIEVTLTDAIEVNVTTVAPYFVKLGGGTGDTLKQNEDGTYSADYDEKDITIELYKADANGITGEKATFYDVVIKDGSASAATQPEIEGNVATIKSIKSNEWGKTLTIEVQRTKDKEDKFTAALKVSAASDEVTVTNLETGLNVAENAPIDVRRDSQIRFKITPKTDANLGDLKVEIRSAKENASATDNKNAQDLVKVTDLASNQDGEVTLTVTPGDAGYADPIMLCVLNKRKDADGKDQNDPLKGGAITLNVQDPIVKSEDIAGISVEGADSSNREIRLNLNLNLANKKAVLKAPLDGDLYYLVQVEKATYTGEGTVEFPKEMVELVKIPKSDGVYNPADFAKFVKFDLVVGYKDKDGKAVVLTPKTDIPGTIAADVKVTLIQSYASAQPDSKDAKTYAAGKAETKTFATRIPIYETKLTVKKVDGAAVFTGQKATVAIPTFTKDTSHNNVEVEFVNTKTGVNLDTTAKKWGFTAGKNDDGSVWVEASEDVRVYDLSNSSNQTTKDNFKNLGVKIIASYPDTENGVGYAATAVVKLKIQQGIYDVDADESKAALPTELYRDAKGVVKSVKITPLLNGGYKEYKPAKANVTWAITDEDGDSFENLTSAHMKAALRGKKPLISVKNGTVSVNKAYTLGKTAADNTFYVTVRANDFADDGTNENRKETIAFTITGQNQTIGKLVVVNDSYEVQDAAALKAENFKSDSLYIAAVKSGTPDPAKGESYEEEDFIPVTFKVSGKLLTVDAPDSNKTAQLNFLKPGVTKITAITVDGGKGTGTKAEISITVNAYEKLGLELTSASGLTAQPDDATVKYFGGSNERYTLKLKYYDGKEWQYEYDYKNVKVAVKGGKLISNKAWAKSTEYDYAGTAYTLGDAVVVTDKSGSATIALTDTATKKEVAKYTITNGSNVNTKAPSIKMIDPKKASAGRNKMTYQVTEKTADNYAGKYIKLTPDFTVDSSKNWAYGLVGTSGTILKIDENGQFVLDKTLSSGASYKIVATVGEMSDGEFKALAKDAKISLSVPKNKFSTNLNVTGNYSLDAQGASAAQLIVKTDVAYTVSDTMDVIKKEQNTNDHTNNFTKYFEVKRYVYDLATNSVIADPDNSDESEINVSKGAYATIGLRNTLSAADIAYITGQDKETAKQAKADCEGYITVDNGYYSKDVKVKISFKSVKFTASAPAVYASAKAVTLPVEIYNGKTLVPIAMAELDGTNTFATKKPVVTADGKITLESVANLAADKYEVNLKVVPANAAYNADTKETDDNNAKKVADLVATYGVPVTLKIDVKALDAKKMLNVKNLNITLNSAEYTDKNLNGYVYGTEGNMGNYQVDVPYSFGAYNAALAKKDPVAVTLEGNTIGTDKNAPTLVKAEITDVPVYDEDGDKVFVNGKEAMQSVIRLTVSKKAIETYDAMDRKEKPITGWNKKLTVPVSVQLANANNENAAVETLSFKISIPKKPDNFAAVQAKVKDAKLDKIQTTLDTKASDMIEKLRAKVENKAKAIVPADTDVKVFSVVATGAKPENGAAATDPEEIVEAGTAVITVTLKDMAANKDVKPVEMPFNYSLDVKASTSEEGTSLVSTVKTAIETYLDSYNTEKVATNDTTADSLYADITTKAGNDVTNNIGTRRGNVSIKITSFEVEKKATTKLGTAGNGAINVTVRVSDLIGGEFDEVEKTLTIERLSSIVEAYTAVKAKLDADLAQIIKDCAGNGTLIKEEILRVAKEAAKNPQITIDYKSGDEGFSYKKAIVAGGKDEEDKELKDGREGTLKFVLEMNEGGRVKEVEGEATIAAADAEKYPEIADAVKKVKALTLDTTDETKTNVLAADMKTAIDGADKSDADKIAENIEKAIMGQFTTLVGDDKTDGTIYGYACEVTGITWKAATANAFGTVTFTVTVKSKISDSVTNSFTVEEAEVTAKDPTNMLISELEELLGKYETIEVLKDDKSTVSTELTADLKKLLPASQKGMLKDAEMSVEALTDDNYEMDTEDTAKVKTVKNVKVTVKVKDAETALIEKTISTITVTVKS